MALFRTKKEETDETAPQKEVASTLKEKAPTKKKEASSKGVPVGRNLASVLRAPRITEKATMHSGAGVYVFNVDTKATKRDVALAVERFYKVKPVKVNITQVPSKIVSRRGRGKSGVKTGGKKAYVYLKEGDSINSI
ncbi:50S ribosomal protein L23 [Candidatus Kaiserbacteria bacterium CG10_big_fil_rev_8_21_14_0_10_49_17]|uniref:Large ribosomal subunit protein uL23 n=1 Tax=Candidatus Kaiserbacteria bacterium CG10_big_fil_rev_8_21_14_0_10_49_17 TaxID=1974609 RepID=A0A2M6WEJ5_9BACT|nr:MAG: 50S ribosomal protein L23 [Candidatus Kaiserbacteria bacterium CG10_big_fil_rev_8_21_14_0_10_49_17]